MTVVVNPARTDSVEALSSPLFHFIPLELPVEIPAAPATPAVPATLAVPATPATPATPVTPATPATPAAPATPATPATPVIATTPTVPATPTDTDDYQQPSEEPTPSDEHIQNSQNSQNEVSPEAEIVNENASSGSDSSGIRIYPNANLYDDELQSDLVIVAGINGDTYRYPGHRRVLESTSPVFAAILAATKSDLILIDYIDHRGFENLLRYYYCEPTQLNSVQTARSSLDAGYKFLCPQLTQRCARKLDEMLDAGVALEIMRDLRYLCAKLPGAASAPPLPALTNNRAAELLAQCSSWCDMLAHNALLVIDENADEALQHEKLEDLTYEDLSLIVRRDTLRVSSELVLIEALSRWSTAVCKRYKRELTSSNKRAALGELSYSPRYLLLEGEELDRALAFELLQPIERRLVIARARKLSAPIPVGAHQENLLRRWAKPRPTEPAAAPVHLSPRSEPEPEEPQPSKLCARKPKRLKTPKYQVIDRNSYAYYSRKRTCCQKFGDGLLRAFICLFD
ncbi:unnamed protein product [Leptidea sinapis]|uniref:BTB domain-containing protein n=1 Tax=Leptidea sinapis TaxID=189913 RepID=A0A5E4QYB7_9NEOP|nr:unnamed protein product [Leptidea sinapis]